MSRSWNIRRQLQNICEHIRDIVERINILLRSSGYIDKAKLRMKLRGIRGADLTDELSFPNNAIQLMEEYKQLISEDRNTEPKNNR